VRDVSADAPRRWAKERRSFGERTLSDHAPVEREIL
jgi:hypothetical protein